jgi:transglutaminase-like putative cysteine protease
MEFDVTYRTEIRSLPRVAKDVRVWMPIPPSDEAQTIQNLSVSCPLPYENRKDERYGNQMIYLHSARELESFALEARYHVVRERVGTQPGSLDVAAAQKYLRLTSRVRVTEDVEDLTKRVVGNTRTPVEVGEKVYAAIIDLLTYDKKIPGCGTGDTAWIMKHKRGKCDDYHALFMAMMISRGIAVRWEQGFPLPYPSGESVTEGRLSGDCSGAHCWVSFYDPEMGWIPVDVSEGDKNPDMRRFFFGHLTPNRFKISEGRSIVLNPAQGGDPLSTFAYAYAESDGIPLIYPANYENTIRYTVTDVATDPS